MEDIENVRSLRGGKKFVMLLLFCVICIAVNFIGSHVATGLSLPFYFDCLGSVLAGVFGGYMPGIIVGYLTNFVTSLNDPSSFYYCLSSVLIAVCSAFASRRGWFGKPHTVLLIVFLFALCGGVLGSVITWFLYSAATGEVSSDFAQQVMDVTGMAPFAAQVCSDFLIDLADKGITVVVALVVMRILPDGLRSQFDFTFWQQEPLEGEQLEAAKSARTRGLSLRAKVALIVAVVMAVVAAATISISFMMFHRSNIEAQGRIAEGVANLAVQAVDADRVGEFLKEGEAAPGYAETEARLATIRDNAPETQYVYVYRIQEDGCHVVFDPDTADEPGSDPGDVIPFDDAFLPYRDDLLAGRSIAPVVSNESYGWLLTVYRPIVDSNGRCAAYAAVDISMDTLVSDEMSFLARVIILFVAFFVLICAVAIWFTEYGLVMPVNSISRASGNFAFDSETTRSGSVQGLRDLGITTGDEVENLYQAVLKTSEDTVDFIADSQQKAATIERMQDNLIMVMADLVESRDQHTGDHVRKTAAYTKAIMDQMRREGIYADVLTDEYIANVVKSVPLHDVGKIEVSDTILNKPGRLTDEEFAIMRSHTTAGEKILEDAKGAMSEAGYLDEAQRLAAYHHEKWNGQGYPYGLSAEDIPLSARIMAVADVFDALVSKRAYKDGMPIEKALDIIRKDAGTHFDPLVAQAFLDAEDEVRRIAAEHGDAEGTAEDIRA